MEQDEPITTEIPGETKRQYMAWLLYCETESINRLLRKWKEIQTGKSKAPESLKGIKENLGRIPSRGTVVNWSKKFRWVKRKEKKLTEDSKIILEKIRQIKIEEWVKILEILPKLCSTRNEPINEFVTRINKTISTLNQKDTDTALK